MNILTQIWNGIVVDVEKAHAWIDGEVAAIEKALPSAKATINDVSADLKQAASDAIDLIDTGLNSAAPIATKAIEAAADTALTAYTGGFALPLTPLTNDAVDKVEQFLLTNINAWSLKAKAALAANNAPPAPPPAPPVVLHQPEA